MQRNRNYRSSRFIETTEPEEPPQVRWPDPGPLQSW